MEVKLLHHACNFSSEVVSTLLQAFALLEAGELDDLDVAAQILSDLSGVLSNGQVAKDLGGEIKIVKFARFVKGEGLEKRADDFASEVASMVK